jgi:putative tryptophan/tyrosine transport system substrate-binding protein
MTVLSRGAAMRRREFITLIGGAAAAWPLGARAQQTSKVWRVGMLETTSATPNAVNVDAFRRGLRQLGYVEGQNLIIEYRSGEGRIDRFPELAAEMVRLKVDIIVTRGTPAALAAKNATATIPIVMAAIGEPVGTGMVLSLAQPGGNVTGLSAFVNELAAKRIEIMREIVPKILRMAMIDNMGNAAFHPSGMRSREQRLLSVSSRSCTTYEDLKTLDPRSMRLSLSRSMH